jgi:hypothetical protein
MATPTAAQVSEALALTLKLVEARNGKPSGDPQVWRRLLCFAPPWTVSEAAFRLREERRERRAELQRLYQRMSG